MLGREWERRFAELKAFHQKYGHCKVPPRWPGNRPLADWVAIQRNRWEQLSVEQLQRLHRLGLEFGRYGDLWLLRFFELVVFKRRYGHCNVLAHWRGNPSLGEWVWQQRANHRRRRLTLNRWRLLAQLGLEWDPLGSVREKRFQELRKFKAEYGHCRVPGRWAENASLAIWVENVRHRKAQLSAEQIKRLDDLAFEWQPYRSAWEKRFAQLTAYRCRYGHCNVPARWPQNPQLGTWVSLQRQNWAQGKLSRDQKKRLDELGFDWAPFDTAWEKKFEQLKAFKARFGHSRVPVDWPQNRALGRWVAWHRERTARVSPAHRKRLDELGFNWKPRGRIWENVWERHFGELIAFKKKYGHCRVPEQWPENRALAGWVHFQRHRFRKGQLLAAHKHRLDQIGFDWDPYRTRWEAQLEQLRRFRLRYGHCKVPRRWPENPSLASWVHNQRHTAHLTRNQKRSLNELGFVWGVRGSPGKRRFVPKGSLPKKPPRRTKRPLKA